MFNQAFAASSNARFHHPAGQSRQISISCEPAEKPEARLPDR